MQNKNLMIFSLINDNIKELCLAISKKLDFFYLNTEDLINYSLFDKEKMEDVCGLKYVEKEEKKVVNSLNSYERTVISIGHRTFTKNFSLINKNNTIIYLQVSKDDLEKRFNELKTETLSGPIDPEKVVLFADLNLDLIVFEERDKFFEKNCDFVIKYDISNIKETEKAILKAIKGKV